MRPPPLRPAAFFQQTRGVSSSPYGRTHVWKTRPPVLPNPVVPKYPQRVIRSDGTSFTHWTTSPRSILRLTRDMTNNPMWNTGVWTDEGAVEDEASKTGRLGRFNRKFEGIGGMGEEVDWMGGVYDEDGKGVKMKVEGELVDPSKYMQKKKKGGKKGKGED